MSFPTTLLLLTVLVVLLPSGAYAFGAGDIPDWGYLNSKAFRHGDIEAVLIECLKQIGSSGGGGGGLMGFAKKVLSSGGKKFTKSDVQKVYFGNWLRDYSQCMDIAGLSKLSADTLVLVVQILGFMAFGYSTEEFEVTADRLGVYLCTEHIDNPKGYAITEENEDARKYHPKLRGPVNNEELEIDESNGMKKYMATEGQSWDTSTALLKRTFRSCIERGRQAQGNDGPDLWEAYRLLGTGMHTMEDLLAHSNWCEVALLKMGHEDVFCHVGSNVSVNTPNGQAPPLITGTFGGADFMHSLLGEAGDKLSQASVTDLSAKMEAAKEGGDDSKLSILKEILSKIPSNDENKMNKGEELKNNSKAYHFDADNVAPPEVQKQLLDVLKWHDEILRDISKKIEMIPGLNELMENLTNALNAYIYTVLEPWLTPILQQVTAALGEGSAAVISGDDQFEVFNNDDASDPSHSMLSKDHFGLILNEPAGQIAQVVVRDTVDHIVKAWFDDSKDIDQTIDEILEAFHHPYYATGNSTIQQAMFQKMEEWVASLGGEKDEIIGLLTKENVKEHHNKRPGAEEQEEAGYGGHSHGPPRQQQQQQHSTPQYGGQQESTQSSYGGQQSHEEETPSYGQHESNRSNRNEGSEYDGEQQSYGGSYNTEHEYSNSGHGGQREEEHSYGGQENGRSNRYENSGYGGQEQSHSSRNEEHSYESSRNEGHNSSYNREEHSGYGGSRDEGESRSSYGQQESNSHEGNSYGRNNDEEDTSSYGRNESESHGRSSYGNNDESESHHGRSSYGNNEESSYGHSSGDNEESSYGRSSRDNEESSYGRSSYGNDDSECEDTSESFGRMNLNNDESEEHNSYGRRRNEDEGY